MIERTGPGRFLREPLLAAVCLAAAGCHQVIIDGGLAPTETRYEEEWNLAFAAAIFPAKPVPPTGCNGYFSEVETRHSFLNLVVTTFTMGIISPMESNVVCGAAAGAGSGDTGAAESAAPEPTPAAAVESPAGREDDHGSR